MISASEQLPVERVEQQTGRVERVEREGRPVENGDGSRVRAVGTSQRVNGLMLVFLPETNCDCVKVETGRCSLLVTPVTVAEDPHLQEVLLTTGGSAVPKECSRTKRSHQLPLCGCGQCQAKVGRVGCGWGLVITYTHRCRVVT